jgi:hypothetical protein
MGTHLPSNKALPILPTPGLDHPRFTRLRFMTADAGVAGTAGAGGGEGGESGSGKEFKAPATQAELNAIIKQRVDRERAKFADYDDLKTKASEYDKVTETSKSEAQKASERLEALERELENTRTSALRTRVAADFGISTKPAEDGGPSDADLFLTASDEATLIKQAERLAGRVEDRKKQGNRAPLQGHTSSKSADDPLREFAAGLFKRD